LRFLQIGSRDSLSSFSLLGVGFVFTSKVVFSGESSFLDGFFSVFLLRRVFFSILAFNLSRLSFFSGFSGLSVDGAVASDEVFSGFSVSSDAFKILFLNSNSVFSDSVGISEHRFEFVEGVDIVSGIFDSSLEELDFSGNVGGFGVKLGELSGQFSQSGVVGSDFGGIVFSTSDVVKIVQDMSQRVSLLALSQIINESFLGDEEGSGVLVLFSGEVSGVNFSESSQEFLTLGGLIVVSEGLEGISVSGLTISNFVDPLEDTVGSIVSSLGLKLAEFSGVDVTDDVGSFGVEVGESFVGGLEVSLDFFDALCGGFDFSLVGRLLRSQSSEFLFKLVDVLGFLADEVVVGILEISNEVGGGV